MLHSCALLQTDDEFPDNASYGETTGEHTIRSDMFGLNDALLGKFPALTLVALCAVTGFAHAAANVDSAAMLHARYSSLQEALNDNEFRRPIRLESSDVDGSVTGDVYALLDFPFASTSDALGPAANWCDVLLLHFNVKFCQPTWSGEATALDVAIGRKYDQPLSRAHRVNFVYGVESRTADFLHVRLTSSTGPLKTSNYRIVLQAVPLGSEQTFLHFSYAYDYGTVGKLAMKAYLGTIGRNKVGFSVDGNESDGKVRYIGGMRGAVERNAMRYYLAIEAFLDTLYLPQHDRWETRLRHWFDAVERYPLQLHEMTREEYLDMKRNEILRQEAAMLIPVNAALQKQGQARR